MPLPAHPPFSRRRRTSPARLVAQAAALALTAALASPVAAFAAPAPAPSITQLIAAGAAAHAGDQPPASEADKAIAQARKTGKNVPVPSLTTEYSDTVATPQGHLTQTQHVDQQRIKHGSDWVTLDPTLARAANGSLQPKASASALTLSGGGKGPLATMTTSDGKQLSIAAPFALPTPTVNGATAVYPNVTPGTDLQVTTTGAGGFSTVLVIKNAQAAADPALKKLHWATTTKGVTVRTDSAGNLAAVDSSGKPAFAAPAPTMWDSSTAPAPAGHPAALAAGSDAAAAPSPAPVADSSTAQHPGLLAKTAPLAVAASGNGIDLTPDQSLLSNPGLKFPVFVDPSWQPATAALQSWTWVQTGSNSSHFREANPHLGVGICAQYPNGGSCSPSITYRSFYQFDITGFAGAVINSAALTANQYSSADWNCSTQYPVDLYTTDGIDSGTVWDNQPGNATKIATQQFGGSGHSGCGNEVSAQYDVTGTFQSYASRSAGTITFSLRGDESNDYALKFFDYSPSLAVTYDRTPNPPTNPYAYPHPTTVSPAQTNEGCGTGYGWLGAGTNLAGTVTLNATVSSPVQSQLYSWTHIWDDTVPSVSMPSGYSPLVASGSNASFQLPGNTLQNGHLYTYSSFAADQLNGVGWAGPTPGCSFGVDLTPPTISFPTSVSDLNNYFPPSGNGQTTNLWAGQRGYVPFTATDPAPGAGLISSGLACARWGWDPQLAGDQWQCGGAMPQNAIQVVPGHWGTNILYVQVEDNAGNYSGIGQYSFYAPWNPNGPAPVFGDVTGDSVPDIVTPDSNGNLRAYNVPGNPIATSNTSGVLAADTAHSPNGLSWANTQISHRGSFTGGKAIDDLVAHEPGSSQLYVYGNPGDTGAYGKFDKHTLLAKPACVDNAAQTNCVGYDAKDWSTTEAIAALGDPSSTGLDTSKHFLNRTSLVTEEDNASGGADLWYYPVVSDNTLGQPVRLSGDFNWKGWDLISPGDWAGQGQPGLWARNRSTGELRGYTFSKATQVSGTDRFNNPITWYTLASIATTSTIGSVAASDRPYIGSDGDISGNGHPGLWTVNTSRGIEAWDGVPAGTAANPGYTWQHGPYSAGTTSTADIWPLNGTGADTGAVNAIQTPGNSTWTANHAGTANGAASFNGNVMGTALNPTWGKYTLAAGMNLSSGQRVSALTSTLTMQPDGNLVLAAANSPIPLWASGTFGHPGAIAKMQSDGNFVIYDTNNNALWSTVTNGNSGSTIALQSDHNLVVYSATGSPLWNSNTFNATFNGPIPVAASGPSVDTSNSYTLAAWVRVNGDTNNDQTFVSQNGDTVPSLSLTYRKYNNSWVVFAPGEDDSNATWYCAGTGSNTATYNTWTHLVATYDTGTHALTLYVNGQFAGSTTQPTPWGANRQLTVGEALFNNATSVVNKLNGAVSDIRSYPYALTPQQVTAMYNGS
ncbi:hypothetical protein P3T36_001610 [Kitasatospora sp. MAP12-15]|uniref:LamG-like jellyroll fold domain-containing protein n=1 Tax=unclassified Kitasatospora TaxID=2633591 RepID=UPI0024739865|nr:LamG-like jellyroll fold domain-containing protein [Kitasatospora sp. MAP12-44]MDH6113511.1 hypothetical protein [Kitasatospora sp. MAP12-44]